MDQVLWLQTQKPALSQALTDGTGRNDQTQESRKQGKIQIGLEIEQGFT